jgi:hypothetical protein
LEQAKNWLEKAFRLGDSKKIKLMALEDLNLEPLWREIGKTCARRSANPDPRLSC